MDSSNKQKHLFLSVLLEKKKVFLLSNRKYKIKKTVFLRQI